jgi:uncharacterized membrane protein YfcA
VHGLAGDRRAPPDAKKIGVLIGTKRCRLNRPIGGTIATAPSGRLRSCRAGPVQVAATSGSSHRPIQPMLTALILLAGLWAGLQNSLAGGGSFITLPALILSGMSPLAANITSTVALFPGQVTAGLAGRKLVTGVGRLSFRALFVISLLGGAAGGLLLLLTPSSVFTRLVPWLVLFATGVFAWGSFFRKPAVATGAHLGPGGAGVAQFFIAVYGGYFGGGIGFLMIAALTMAGLPTRNAGATKNALAGVMNASAVLLFVASPQVHWHEALLLGAGAVVGGLMGSWALQRVNEKALRIAIVCIGAALTLGLFLKPI